jgi:hypothetical protein
LFRGTNRKLPAGCSFLSSGFQACSCPCLNDPSQPAGEARLRYLDADIEVLAPGDYVVCAVTNRKIPVQALRYWSVDRQEAYWDADAASSRMVPAKD